MTAFTTRVVLFGSPAWGDYQKLHVQMGARGFVDEIRGDNGIVYKMPPAEYDFVGNVSLQYVHDLAKAAAGAVWAKNAVFVTQANGRQWSGLEPAAVARR